MAFNAFASRYEEEAGRRGRGRRRWGKERGEGGKQPPVPRGFLAAAKLRGEESRASGTALPRSAYAKSQVATCAFLRIFLLTRATLVRSDFAEIATNFVKR